MSQIETFNVCAAIIFERLYQRFPLPTNITTEMIPDYFFESEDSDDYLAHMSREVTFLHAAEWLVRAGYIWKKDSPGAAILDAVLSPKGLEVLKAMPESISTEQTLGDRLSDLAEKGSYSLLSKVVDKALAIGVAMGTGGAIS